MTELENSKRVLLQATYTPLKSKEVNEIAQPVLVIKRPFDILNLVKSIAPTDEELWYVKNNNRYLPRTKNKNKDELHKEYLKVIRAIEAVIPELENLNVLNNVAHFSETNTKVFESVIEDVIKFRKAKADSTLKSLDSIFDTYKQQNGDHYTNPRLPKYNETKDDRKSLKRSVNDEQRTSRFSSKDMADTPFSSSLAETVLASSDITVKILLNWAKKHGIENESVNQILDLGEDLELQFEMTTVADFGRTVLGSIAEAVNIKENFIESMRVQPVGLLHLEKLNFTPVGIERGELIHSVPLSPAEEVNISHKEWSNTSEEFQRIVTDYMEGFSEEGVTEKTDMAQSTNSQQQHSNGYNLSVTASGGYGPVNITASAAYNSSDASSTSEQTSRNHSASVTRKASSRVTKEHKISFKVASASGTEDQAVQKIKNPFSDKAIRIDYYQLLRKWKIDLTRYGLRLTYDITIPEPGLDILSKIEEINTITSVLTKGFPEYVSPIAPPFTLKPEELTEDNYELHASKYGIMGDGPLPEEITPSPAHQERHWSSEQSFAYYVLEIEVDEKYEVSFASISTDFYPWTEGVDPGFVGGYCDVLYQGDNSIPWGEDVTTGLYESTNLVGKSGKLVVVYRTYSLLSCEVYVNFKLKRKPTEFKAWRVKTWTAIRDAAQSLYEMNRQIQEKRLALLKEELGAGDTLSLRKIEREEVMKGVMRWLFGPFFKFVDSKTPPKLYDESDRSIIDKTNWKRVSLQGEIIKFVHHAIEWENMLYILYPYFWSHTDRWDLKMNLQHPDIMHKVFLKSGCARVVLTLRPGFEEQFISFMQTGELKPEQAAAYLSISQEMENFAKTNYPGVPSANPVHDARPLILPLQRKAWEEMQTISKLLDAYYEEHKDTENPYPSTIEGETLKKYLGKILPPIKEVPLIDPWKVKYDYKYPGKYDKFDLVSYGADGKPGGTGANADITSWAESSLIGTWYEYTPTSALDIAFNEILPSA